ncbi:MAG: DUF4113 domain-containing protein, partial [Ruminiclostridium sp.]|nr:DUF4113 domain-containing protein [Ruminiclostridium sp.]
ITITAQGLLPEDEAGDQMDLFAPQASAKREKQEKLERTMDQIRERYGRDMIRFASRETDTAREIAGERPRKNKEETP